MPSYRYKAINARGEVLEGQMDAASEREVILRLQEQGNMPVEARLASEGGGRLAFLSWFRAKPFGGQLLVRFTQQLATLLGSGQTLDRALTILVNTPEDEKSKPVLLDIRDAVREGVSLSAALERQHGVFSKLYVNMIRAGEAGGSLQDTLARLADYLERTQTLKGRVINALIYPIILLLIVGGALMFLMGYVVPQFAQMYESLDVPLPWFTRGVLMIGQWVNHGWFIMVVVPVLFLGWLERKRHDAEFRSRWDGWLLEKRVVGPLIAKLETARLCRTLGTLLKNGVPVLMALNISRNVLGNQAMAKDIETAVEDVKNGRGLSVSLAQGKRFPHLALQMIQVGEESGALDTMLLKSADTMERETSQAMDRALAALVPVVTLLLASLVGVVIIAVLVPLYDLTGAIA